MAQFHFVEDYERHVSNLVANHPLDEAMSLAVGGFYAEIGTIQLDVVKFAGLQHGMTLLDLGCGSGRLAVKTQGLGIQYVGIDVVQDLLDYAKSKTPSHYRFIKNHTLTIPLPDQSVDMVCAFSLFTHLLHAETYLYLEECKRILRPAGKIIFSFLEFAMPMHWDVFSATVEQQRASTLPALNQFLEFSAIKTMCDHLGFHCQYIAGTANPWGTSGGLGQSIAVLD